MSSGGRGRTGLSGWRLPLSRGAATLGVLFSYACQVYVPAGTPAPTPGTLVRVLIEPDAVQRVSEEAGQPMPPYLRGRLLGSSGDSVRVSVLMPVNPQDVQRNRQVFSVASSEVLEIQRQALSRPRTALLGGTVAALLVLAFTSAESSGGSQGQVPDQGDPPP